MKQGAFKTVAAADAAGLLNASASDGHVIGMALTAEAPGLALRGQQIDFRTTAIAAALLQPAYLTADPYIADLEVAAAARSPQLAKAAGDLRAAATRYGTSYLSKLSDAEQADLDVLADSIAGRPAATFAASSQHQAGGSTPTVVLDAYGRPARASSTGATLTASPAKSSASDCAPAGVVASQGDIVDLCATAAGPVPTKSAVDVPVVFENDAPRWVLVYTDPNSPAPYAAIPARVWDIPPPLHSLLSALESLADSDLTNWIRTGLRIIDDDVDMSDTTLIEQLRQHFKSAYDRVARTVTFHDQTPNSHFYAITAGVAQPGGYFSNALSDPNGTADSASDVQTGTADTLTALSDIVLPFVAVVGDLKVNPDASSEEGSGGESLSLRLAEAVQNLLGSHEADLSDLHDELVALLDASDVSSGADALVSLLPTLAGVAADIIQDPGTSSVLESYAFGTGQAAGDALDSFAASFAEDATGAWAAAYSAADRAIKVANLLLDVGFLGAAIAQGGDIATEYSYDPHAAVTMPDPAYAPVGTGVSHPSQLSFASPSTAYVTDGKTLTLFDTATGSVLYRVATGGGIIDIYRGDSDTNPTPVTLPITGGSGPPIYKDILGLDVSGGELLVAWGNYFLGHTHLVGYDLTTGKPWDEPISVASGVMNVCGAQGLVLVAGGTLDAHNNYYSTVTNYDPASGTRTWEWSSSTLPAPAKSNAGEISGIYCSNSTAPASADQLNVIQTLTGGTQVSTLSDGGTLERTYRSGGALGCSQVQAFTGPEGFGCDDAAGRLRWVSAGGVELEEPPDSKPPLDPYKAFSAQGQVVYAGDAKGALYAYSPAAGKDLWKPTQLSNEQIDPVSFVGLLDGTVWAASGSDDFVSGFAAPGGDRKFSMVTPGDVDAGLVDTAHNQVIFAFDGGLIGAYHPSAG